MSAIKSFFSPKAGLILLVLGALAFATGQFNRLSPGDFARRTEKILHKKENAVKQKLDEYYAFLQDHQPRELFYQNTAESENIFKTQGIVYLVYENDSLLYWSDNSASVENYMKEVCLDNSLAKLRNGYFEVIRHSGNKINTRQLIGLILLKNEFNYQNKYLTNEFFEEYKLPKGTELSEAITNSSTTVKNADGTPLFDLRLPEQVYANPVLSAFSVFFYLLFFFALVFMFWRTFLHNGKDLPKNRWVAIFLLSVLLVRALMIFLRIPAVFYETDFYNPSIYGNADSFWFAYFGDVLINSLLFFYAAFVVQQYAKFHIATKRDFSLFCGGGLIFLFAYANLINTIINSLVENSGISFNAPNLFSLNLFSFLGFACVALLFFSYYLLADKFIALLVPPERRRSLVLLLFFAGALALQLLWNYTEAGYDLLKVLWPAAVMIFIFLFKWRNAPYSFSYGLIFIVVFSFITTHIFLNNENDKEIGTRKIYAERLADQQDAVAENLFVDISKKIRNDVKLKSLIFQVPAPAQEIEQRLRQVYFSGYWERFDVSVSVMDSACVPLIKTTNPLHENNTYFDDQIGLSGTPTVCKDLFYIQSLRERTRYVAKIPVTDNVKPWRKPALIYLEIDSKLSPDVIGFPELLLDKSVKTNNQLSDYSYAVYKNKKLVQRYGKYPFNYQFHWKEVPQQYTEVLEKHYLHLIYSSDPQTIVVISKEKQVLWEKFTTNSYFFMFFSLILLLFLYIREWRARKKLMNTSLNLRIQLLLVSVVFVSLLGFGIGTFVFINRQFETKNTEALDEKIKSVLSELQGKLGEQDKLEANYKEYTAYILKKLSNVFSSDISMFDLKGNLFATSQPRLFEEGIISKKMNPQAFDNIVSGAFINFVIRENIGNLNYFSAYQPFYNKEGKLLAYVNLPYFARQKDLEKEISIYVVALINIYVILFAFGTIVALFISNLVTKPLRIIQQRLSKITLGKRSEPISWGEKDEIGSLVNEYNSMIVQLEESALKLAKTERESAWREMARQVAHEIKNPLTPMKLSIQHLQRTIETNPEDLKERIKKLSVMLVEQIDTLSHIASEFSSFAKMPVASVEKLDLREILKSSADLFKDSEHTSVVFNEGNAAPVYINADKNQMIRVLTNLIKNATQAIPEDKAGIIELSLLVEGATAVVKVKDNGTGIPPEVMDKIFVPNFSTKTEGMGLGLAMVKNIVESFDGAIRFETVQGEGTVFSISLPLAV